MIAKDIGKISGLLNATDFAKKMTSLREILKEKCETIFCNIHNIDLPA
jgi:hypothetical protein